MRDRSFLRYSYHPLSLIAFLVLYKYGLMKENLRVGNPSLCYKSHLSSSSPNPSPLGPSPPKLNPPFHSIPSHPIPSIPPPLILNPPKSHISHQYHPPTPNPPSVKPNTSKTSKGQDRFKREERNGVLRGKREKELEYICFDENGAEEAGTGDG